MQIPDHEQLHTAKRLIIATVPAQDRIHGIQQVGPHHADLVNHQQIKAFDNPFFFFAESEQALPALFIGLTARNKWAKGQLEKRMEGDASGINGRNPGWGGDDHPFCGIFFQLMQKGGFSGAGFSG